MPVQLPHPHVAPRGPFVELAGKWSGHGFQYNNNSDWDIELTIDPTGADVGEPVGTVEYPGLDCGGILLRRPEHGDGTLVVQEKITHGVTNCIDGGTFQLPPRATARSFAWKWFSREGEEQAQGTVHQ